MMESVQLKSRSRLVGAGAMLLPVLGVVCVSYLTPKPASAKAKQVVAAQTEGAHLRMPSDAWLRTWERAEPEAAIEGSPFPAEVAEALLPAPYEIEEPPAPESEPEPQIKLSGIMRSASGEVAMIDGKALAIGGRIEGSWIVGAIDAKARTITVVNEGDGRELLIRLQGP